MREGDVLEVGLRRMAEDEFEAYQAYFVAEYAQEIMDNYGHSNITALKMANAAIQGAFPNGDLSDNQDLLSIELVVDKSEKEKAEVKNERAQLAGYLWRKYNDKEASCFILDFYIMPSMRSKGLGKQAIQALEEEVNAKGYKEIKLRVAYQNMRAAALYKALGFTITGINMSKRMK